MAKTLKTLRIKQDVMRQNIRHMQLKFAHQKWQARVKKTLKLRRRDRQVIIKYNSKTLKQCLQALRSSAQASKLLVTRTVKFIKRLQAVSLADGFS